MTSYAAEDFLGMQITSMRDEEKIKTNELFIASYDDPL